MQHRKPVIQGMLHVIWGNSYRAARPPGGGLCVPATGLASLDTLDMNKSFAVYLKSEATFLGLPWNFPRWVALVVVFLLNFWKWIPLNGRSPLVPVISGILWTGGLMLFLFVDYLTGKGHMSKEVGATLRLSLLLLALFYLL